MIALALGVLTVPLPWLAAGACAAAVHELGHLIALWGCGIRIIGMEIDAGGAAIRTGPMEPREELCCALAGPVAGAMICLFWRWVPRMALWAAVQTLFNLVPVCPLDGGRALAAARNICCKERGKGL